MTATTPPAYAEGDLLEPPDASRVEVLIPSQIDLALYRDNCSHPDRRLVAIFAHGRFPKEDPDIQIILSSWLARHEEAWNAIAGDIPVTCFGLDVSRSLDGDATILTAGSDVGMRELRELMLGEVKNVIVLADRVIEAASEYGIDLTKGRNPVAVDMGGGYGNGVADNLAARGVWVIEFHPSSASTVNPRVWGNLRCQSYAMLGLRLDPAGPFPGAAWPIQADERLRRELVAPEKHYSQDGIRFLVEPKDVIKKEKLHGQSPDYADAVTYLYHAVVEYHNLAAYFQAYTGPLTMWPSVSSETERKMLESDRDHQRAKMDEELAGLTFEVDSPEKHNGGNGAGGNGKNPVLAESTPDTLQWLRDEYGGNSGGTRFDHLFWE